MTEDTELLARPTDPHRVVRASAGSGKTHRLAVRYLEILFSGGKPESIVAATFTREAAGEILGRVLTRLASAAADAGEARRLGAEIGRADLARRQCERALRALCGALDRIVVSTLDSFFYRLTAALRFELGLHGAPAVAALDDPLLLALREEALEATLRTLAERDWRDLVDLFERLHGAGARRSVARSLDALLLELYGIYLEAPGADLWGKLELPPPVEGAELATALDVLEDMLRASAPGALRRALAEDLAVARRGEWDRLLARGLAGKIATDAVAPRYGSAAIPPGWTPALAVVVAHARRAVLDAQVARTRATHRLLDAFHRHYWSLRLRRGLLLFDDLAGGLLRWLPARAGAALEELYYRIDARVGHLLLDEFQDTSLAQWSVLRPIAEEIRAWGDGSRTFFCVGDPKQAIYGWRGGCADLFDQIEEDLALEPGSGERLDESFRSSQTVLDTVNRVFGGLGEVAALKEHRDAVERWSTAFGPHRARVAIAGYCELVESPPEGEHREWAAGRVGDVARALPGASIAVLVQTNEQAGALLDALRRRGIEASGEGGGAVADDPAVTAVIAALDLADHPGDTVAAFHVAGCPLGSLVGLRSRVPVETRAASRRIRRAFVDTGARELLAAWARALGAGCDERSERRLAQAVDLAARFDREGGGRPGDLAAFLRRATVESPRGAGVRVMTVHRAKGLEFDAVVLPALERPLLRGADAPVYLVRRSPLAPVDAVHRSAPASVRRLAPELEGSFEQERARRLRDDLSVLYVALTRARHSLYLWVEPAAPAAAAGERRPALSFAAILRATLAASAETAEAAVGRVQTPVPMAGSSGATTTTAVRSPDPGGRALYVEGDLGAVAAAIGAARSAARHGGQRILPLAPGRPAVDEAIALRPAVRLEDLAAATERRAAEVLAEASGGSVVTPLWHDLEAVVASIAGLAEASPSGAGSTAVPAAAGSASTGVDPSVLARAASWLLAGGRRLEARERDRRFLCAVGSLTVVGELERVWIAARPGSPSRVLVGAALPGAASTALDPVEEGSADAGLKAAAARGVTVLRLAAARALAIDEEAVAVLWCGPDRRVVLSLP